MKISLTVLSLILSVSVWSVCAASCEKASTLFVVERNKNGNVVHYEVCLNENSDLADPNPVRAYWILENGEKETLTEMERRFAYGIASQQRVGKNRFRILLTAVKDRNILVEKIGDMYRAIIPIRGKPSILERVYVQADERWSGLPKVRYVDLLGRTLHTNTPIKERITR